MAEDGDDAEHGNEADRDTPERPAADDIRALFEHLAELEDRARLLLTDGGIDPETALDSITFFSRTNARQAPWFYVGDAPNDSLEHFGPLRFAIQALGFCKLTREMFSEFGGLAGVEADPAKARLLLRAFNLGRQVMKAQMGCGLPETYSFLHSQQGQSNAKAGWQTQGQQAAKALAIECAREWWESDPEYQIGLISEHIASRLKDEMNYVVKPNTVRNWLVGAEKNGVLRIPAEARRGGRPRK